MLFWLLVYVTVLLSWFQSNMFQYVVYMRTLIKQHTKQIDQPLFGLLTWIVSIAILKTVQILTSNMAQEIQEFKIHKSSQRQDHHMQEFYSLSQEYVQGLPWLVCDNQSNRKLGKAST